jgi:hypothetical protein
MKPAPLRLGEPRTAAAWFRTEKDRAFAEEIVREAYRHDTKAHGALFTPIEFRELAPGQDGYPNDPPGPALKVLVGRAKVHGFVARSVREVASFIDELSDKDHKRLRAATRHAYRRLNPGKPDLTDAQCDRYIQMAGPDVHEAEIRHAVDSGLVS